MWNRIKPINNGLNIKPEMPEEGQWVLITDGRTVAIQQYVDNGNGLCWNDCSYAQKYNAETGMCEDVEGVQGFADFSTTLLEHKNITHWQPLPGEPFNHIEGECSHKECVSYCPSLEKE